MNELTKETLLEERSSLKIDLYTINACKFIFKNEEFLKQSMINAINLRIKQIDDALGLNAQNNIKDYAIKFLVFYIDNCGRIVGSENSYDRMYDLFIESKQDDSDNLVNNK